MQVFLGLRRGYLCDANQRVRRSKSAIGDGDDFLGLWWGEGEVGVLDAIKPAWGAGFGLVCVPG